MHFQRLSRILIIKYARFVFLRGRFEITQPPIVVMRSGLTLILFLAYSAATIGLPENMGMPSTGCRCATRKQDAGLCCCMNRNGRDPANGDHGKPPSCCQKQRTSTIRCQANASAASMSPTDTYSAGNDRQPDKLPPCCAARAATSWSPTRVETHLQTGEQTPQAEPIAGLVWSRCSCGSGPAVGLMGVTDPRLPLTRCRIAHCKIRYAIVTLQDDTASGPSLLPDTPPPKLNCPPA